MVGPKGKSAGVQVDAGTLTRRSGTRAARYQPGCSANCQRQPLSTASNAFA